MNVSEVADDESGVLYYAIQVMALYNPVDASLFKHINDIRVMYKIRINSTGI